MVRKAAPLALVLLLAPGGAAVGPLDDDARSGGDAGDTRKFALVLEVEAFSGKLSRAGDYADFYEVLAGEGDTLAITLALAPGIRATLYGADGRHYQQLARNLRQLVYLPREGPWYVGFEALPNDIAVHAPYTATLQRVPEAPVQHTETSRAWMATELRWSAAAPVQAIVVLALDPERTAPFEGMLLAEYAFDDGVDVSIRDYTAIAISGTSFSQRASVSPAVVAQVEVGPFLENGKTATLVQVLLVFPPGTGWLRVSAYHTTAASTVRLTAFGGAGVAIAEQLGDGVLAWRESNAGSRWQVLLPAASVTGPRTLDLQVEGRFIGHFFTWTAKGIVVRPDGSHTTLPRLTAMFLLGPTHGQWSFGLGPTAGAGPTTEYSYLTGAFIPLMGLTPA